MTKYFIHSFVLVLGLLGFGAHGSDSNFKFEIVTEETPPSVFVNLMRGKTAKYFNAGDDWKEEDAKRNIGRFAAKKATSMPTVLILAQEESEKSYVGFISLADMMVKAYNYGEGHPAFGMLENQLGQFKKGKVSGKRNLEPAIALSEAYQGGNYAQQLLGLYVATYLTEEDFDSFCFISCNPFVDQKFDKMPLIEKQKGIFMAPWDEYRIRNIYLLSRENALKM